MPEQHNGHEPPSPPIPEAVVYTRSRFSLVWLIPLIAATIGAWLAYKALSEQEPTITITFQTAEGLEAGKTKIKYKDVDIGQVEDIDLSEDLSHVVVTAKLVKYAEKYLTEHTRFWVVRARVAAGQVSGLGTLLGGVYLAVDPVMQGKRAYAFAGLDTPPVVTTKDPGQSFMLQADELGSLQIGSPVYFREIKVGEVVAYDLNASGTSVDVQVFVHAPHHKRVHANTRFWNASGLDISIGANGLEVNTQSVVSLMIGGIAFENPVDNPGLPAEAETVFRLYANRKRAFERAHTRKSRWLLKFTGSVRGLSLGAPVEFRGIRLGEVIDVTLQINLDESVPRIPVLIEIEPDRLELVGHTTNPQDAATAKETGKQVLDWLVAKGLRAQLKTGNLVTGALFIDLDLYPNEVAQAIVWEGTYPELPTVPTPLEEFRNILAKALQKFEQLPLEHIGRNLQQSLAALSQTAMQLQQLMLQLNTKVTPALSDTLTQTQITLRTTEETLQTAQKTLQTAQKTFSSSSPLQQETRALLKELGAAARSIRIMADYLERHPEALIQGKRGSRR